ncbi:hypothetical protein [Qipengyuania qiaonensis]|uniref:DUF3617 family protein n=1 Tax=Qipengyuania qiaonensis TaxID=2867240 RepID=A0ABS7J4X7_9SPHN|nr:hypothetical protein [Qipengyuania qiaonensis]MBX7482395.1 hypothetical protein [Qipengyuania qiaonensis]
MACKRAFLTALLLAPLAAVTSPAIAQASLAMLDSIDRGGWEIRFRDGSSARKVCVRTGRELIQLRHTEGGCNRFVVDDAASEVTVQYTCRGNGYGRTHIRKESASLVQIDSQGIAGGKPFQFTAEARQTGSCG